MKNSILLLSLFSIFFYTCKRDTQSASIEIWKKEIVETERNFAKMAKEEGMNMAFLAFVANDGVLMRNNSLIIGKDSIRTHMVNFTSTGLAWTPDFVDVSNSGDLGYTYGHYTFTYQDSIGNDIVNKGVFHTVWKRQMDGTWKFVWD